MEDLGAPRSYLQLDQGAECYSRDGEQIGKVAEVRAAPEQDIFDGIVLNTGRFVEAADVEEIFERGVRLKLDRREVEALPGAP